MRFVILFVSLCVPAAAWAQSATQDLRSYLVGSADSESTKQVIWNARMKSRAISLPDNNIFSPLQAGLSMSHADPAFSASPIARHVQYGNHCGLDRALLRERLIAGGASAASDTHDIAGRHPSGPRTYVTYHSDACTSALALEALSIP